MGSKINKIMIRSHWCKNPNKNMDLISDSHLSEKNIMSIWSAKFFPCKMVFSSCKDINKGYKKASTNGK